MAYAVKPSDGEINEVLNWANEAEDAGEEHFPGMSFEQGVQQGILWVTGQTMTRPDEE